MRGFQRWTGVAAITALTSIVAVAQEAAAPAAAKPKRDGFYISLGIAWGSANANCSGGSCSGAGSQSSGAGYLGLGGTINEQWRIGFESDAWSKSDLGTTQTVAFYNLMATYYTSPTSDFWLKFGLGYASTGEENGGVSLTSSGFSGGVGLGYDWLPGGGRFAIIPYANYMYQFSGSGVGGGYSASFKGSLLQVGIGFGYKH